MARAQEIDIKKLQSHGKGKMPNDPKLWGISLRQLRHLRSAILHFFKNADGNILDPHMYDINNGVVKPWTKDLSLSLSVLYNRLLPDGGRPANIFISHSWCESFLSLLATLETAVGAQKALALDDCAWICTFAIYQNMTPEEIAENIASPPDSPFARVLRNAEEVAIVFNDRVSLYSRVWCVYEAFLSLSTGKPVRAVGLPPAWNEAAILVSVLKDSSRSNAITDFCSKHPISVEGAEASVPDDKVAIMSAVAGQEQEVNQKTNCFQEWALKDIIMGEFFKLN